MEREGRAVIGQLTRNMEAEKRRANKVRNEVDRLGSELGTIRSRAARDREQAETQAAEARRLKNMVNSSNVRRKAAKDRAALRKQELDGLRAELEAARSETEAVRRSTSWRVTRPLRGIGSLLRRRPAPSSPAPDEPPLPDRSN